MVSTQTLSPFVKFHGPLLGLTVYLSYISNPGSSLFSWHPFMMTISMLFVMNEAILLFSPTWGLLPVKYQKKLYLDAHGYLETIAVVAYGFGFYAIYQNKEDNEKPHFKSWHGLFGLILSILILIQMTIGAVSKYASLLPVKLNVARFKTLHSLLGAFVVLFTVINMVTSCFTNFFISQSNVLTRYALSAALVAIYGFVSIRVLLTNSRIKALFPSLKFIASKT